MLRAKFYLFMLNFADLLYINQDKEGNIEDAVT